MMVLGGFPVKIGPGLEGKIIHDKASAVKWMNPLGVQEGKASGQPARAF
jgi:hypothetical protein